MWTPLITPNNSSNVDVPNLVTFINRQRVLEWYIVRCGSNNDYQKDICLKDIKLVRAQHMLTILSSM
jgi:hypothetical protein